jgi:hypothetical protein
MESFDVIIHPLRALLVEIGAYLPRLGGGAGAAARRLAGGQGFPLCQS